MASSKVQGIVVSHTHWDREWYLPFEEYRVRLVGVVDRLIDLLEKDQRFTCFMLDGQTVILEDYLEIRPERRARLKELISRGRVEVGPWYVQPDERLVSPESLIRNLLIGHRIASEFGGVMKVGYLPDTFGHTATLPTILRGFGLDSFVFQRGLGDEAEGLETEFVWRAPDGSEVLAIFLLGGYCNAALMGVRWRLHGDLWRAPDSRSVILMDWLGEVEPAVDLRLATQRIIDLKERLAGKASTDTILLMNGCDHMPPQPTVPKIIHHANRELEDMELRHGRLSDYIDEVRAAGPALQVYDGEMRGARFHFVVSDTISTRIYLKQMNFTAQTLLECYAEPLSAIAHTLGKPYPRALLTHTWKLLIQNQAHDSICGCGVDQAHREDVTRFQRVCQVADNIVYGALRYIAEQFKPVRLGREAAARVVVFNLLNWPRTDYVSVWLPIPPGEYIIIDSRGGETPVSVVEWEPDRRYTDAQSKVEFLARDVPPCGFEEYALVKAGVTRNRGAGTASHPQAIENEFFEVSADPTRGGALRIRDKATGAVYGDFNVLADEGDAGDEYNYSPPRDGGMEFRSSDVRAEVSVHERNGKKILTVELKLRVPSKLDGQGRSTDLVEVPVRIEVTLPQGMPRVDVKTTLENNADDHRLRVRFPTGLRTGVNSSENHFYVVTRPNGPLSRGEGWVEKPPPTHPQLQWIDVSDGERGVAVANKGLPEYEVRMEGGCATLYLTLIRAVGQLSKGDLTTRRGHAGPTLQTPEAQCRGVHTFEYSIIPHKGTWETSKVYKHAREFCVPFIAMGKSGGGGAAEPFGSFIEVEPDGLVLSALRMAEDDPSLVLRFYNITGRKIMGKVGLSFPVEEAWLCNLNEQPIAKLEVPGGRGLKLRVEPHQVITIKLRGHTALCDLEKMRTITSLGPSSK
ncbi:MAG: alpha-mannosidase [Candidatus Bathyarchaeia archaeon]